MACVDGIEYSSAYFLSTRIMGGDGGLGDMRISFAPCPRYRETANVRYNRITAHGSKFQYTNERVAMRTCSSPSAELT